MLNRTHPKKIVPPRMLPLQQLTAAVGGLISAAFWLVETMIDRIGGRDYAPDLAFEEPHEPATPWEPPPGAYTPGD